MTNHTEAHEYGVKSYQRGHSLHLNPFKDGTVEAKDFIKGWKAEDKRVKAIADTHYRSSKRSSPNFHK